MGGEVKPFYLSLLLLQVKLKLFSYNKLEFKSGYHIQESNANDASKHFMAFGGGMRFCVGTDFTKLQMAVFLHSLVTKYRYELVIVLS